MRGRIRRLLLDFGFITATAINHERISTAHHLEIKQNKWQGLRCNISTRNGTTNEKKKRWKVHVQFNRSYEWFNST